MAPIEHQPSRRQAADYPSKNEFGDQSSPVPATSPLTTPLTKKPSEQKADSHPPQPHDERDTMPEDLPLDVPMRHTEQ